MTLPGNAVPLTNLVMIQRQTPFGTPPPTTPGVEPPRPAAEPTGPSLFTAIQEQLGLRLVPSKGPVDVYVIDSAQKPDQQ